MHQSSAFFSFLRKVCFSIFRFYRSVAYRQFFRLVWVYAGNAKRLPLPCCVYNAIRCEFPEEDGIYNGFLEEDEPQNLDESSSDSGEL